MKMTYSEREKLKRFADKEQCLHEVITMIAHWMRQRKRIPFELYAANWSAAEQRKDVGVMRECWPLTGERMIADNCSDWESYGSPGYDR